MKLRRNNIVGIFSFIGSITLSAQPAIDYKSYLTTIATQHPLALKAQNVNEQGQLQLRAARGGYDPQLKADAEAKYFKNTNYYSVFKSEIKQPIFTSQYIKAGYEYGQGLYLDPQLNTPAFGLPYVGLEMSLLQGMLFDKRRADVLKAGYYKDYFSQEARAQVNDLLLDAAQTYATWLYEARQLQLTTSFVNVAQLRFEGLSGLVKIGERAGIDTVEAAILQQGRDLDRQSVQTAYIRAENEIRFYYGTALQTNLPAPLLSRDSLDKLFEKALKYYSLSAAQNFSANPQLQQYNAKRGLLETDARLKRELIKPKLDVSYNFLNAANASDRLYFGTANYKYGASLSFPVLLRSARNEHKIARLQVMTNELEFQSKDAQVKTKGRYLFETAQLALNQVVVARRSVEFSKQLLEAERLKFENGESSLFLLNTRENKYLETELKLADYQLKFLTQVLQLVHLVGDLNYGME